MIVFGQEKKFKVCRQLRNTTKKTVSIDKISDNNYSKNHTLSIYSIDAIYTLIPKNACSTVRYSIALANGFISGMEDVKWIHSNNRTFIATQREVACAKYAFVILRCPYQRLTLCFLDKFLNRMISLSSNDDLSFRQFCNHVSQQNREQKNEHWRNQSDFLHLKNYDDYFSLENFSEATKKLEDQGLKIVDTREHIGHDTSKLKRVDGNFCDTPIHELRKMKSQGMIPLSQSMYDKETYSIISHAYDDDITLYKEKVNQSSLLSL